MKETLQQNIEQLTRKCRLRRNLPNNQLKGDKNTTPSRYSAQVTASKSAFTGRTSKIISRTEGNPSTKRRTTYQKYSLLCSLRQPSVSPLTITIVHELVVFINYHAFKSLKVSFEPGCLLLIRSAQSSSVFHMFMLDGGPFAVVRSFSTMASRSDILVKTPPISGYFLVPWCIRCLFVSVDRWGCSSWLLIRRSQSHGECWKIAEEVV